MGSFSADGFAPNVRSLLNGVLPPLGPGVPDESKRPLLEALDERALLGGRQPADRTMAACCLSGLWLLHGFLDESHRISQGIGTCDGSYWHGVMHRREPDYWNSKYWFRRVGNHPVFEDLCREARRATAGYSLTPRAQFLASQRTWDPFGFVDLCESAEHGDSPDHSLCVEVAHLEWQLLFDYCHRAAAGLRA
jgi:hypothetical protein